MKLILIGFVSVLLAGPAASHPGENWVSRAPMPQARAEAAVALLDGRIYVIGGWASEGGTDPRVVQVYDIALNRWSAIAPLPKGALGPGAAAADGRVFACGGFVANSAGTPLGTTGQAIDNCWQLDPSQNRWASIASLPSPRFGVAVAALNGQIHVVGGYDYQDEAVDAHDVFDPATGAWSSRAPLPAPLGDMVLISVQQTGKLYAIGGWSDVRKQPSNVNAAYDPTTDSWTVKAPMKTARYGMSAAVVGDRIFVIGGVVGGTGVHTALRTVEVYDVSTDQWSAKKPLDASRAATGAVASNGTIFLPGGLQSVRNALNPVNTLLTLTP